MGPPLDESGQGQHVWAQYLAQGHMGSALKVLRPDQSLTQGGGSPPWASLNMRNSCLRGWRGHENQLVGGCWREKKPKIRR